MAESQTFFRPVLHRTVARALRPAMLWAYVSVGLAALAVGLVALVGVIVSAGVWVFDRQTSIGGSVTEVVQYAVWITGPLAVGAAVAGAAYSSTESRSFPRTVTGTVVGIGIGAALLGVGASLFAAAGLAAGWGAAIPADRPSRAAARGVPLLVLALVATVWPQGQVVGLSRWSLVAVLAVSPAVAALAVWIGDAAWAGISGRKPEPKIDTAG